ncbi:MAG: DUF2953 domain-containing protein [Syntrophomonadaceae bacterium]
MIWSIGAFILLVLIILLIGFKAELTLTVRDDHLWQGFLVNIDSRFFRVHRCYDLSDPSLNLPESSLLALYEKKKPAGTVPQDPPQSATGSHNQASRLRRFWHRQGKRCRIFRALNEITRIEWTSTVGGQDACQAALNSGAAWALKGWLLVWLSTYCKIGKVAIDVRPNFSTTGFMSTAKCILKIRLAQIIFMKAYLSALKSGGE